MANAPARPEVPFELSSLGWPLSQLHERRQGFSKQEEQLFSEIIGQCGRYFGDRLQSVQLVGSRARGTHRPDSDYDLLLCLTSDCDWAVDGSFLDPLMARLERQFHLGEISLSPLSGQQIVAIDAKYPGITDNFRQDAICLWRATDPR